MLAINEEGEQHQRVAENDSIVYGQNNFTASVSQFELTSV